MLYVIIGEDSTDSAEKRRSVRAAHLQRLETLTQENRLVLAGPIFHDGIQDLHLAKAKGSLIVAEFSDLEAAKSWAAADPYVTAEVFKRITVHPFKKVLP